jgi:DNA-binding protein HU-beta
VKLAAPMMPRTKLVEAILEVEETKVSKKQVNDVLDCLAYVAREEISRGNRVRVPGVGTVEVRVRKAQKARTGRNPQTGEAVKIAKKPASTRLGFRPLKELKETLPTVAKAQAALRRGKK